MQTLTKDEVSRYCLRFSASLPLTAVNCREARGSISPRVTPVPRITRRGESSFESHSAAKRSASYLSVRRKAAELYGEGRSVSSIVRYFNEHGYASPSGKSWTHFMVQHLLKANGPKAKSKESVHLRTITDARARGLNYQQMAVEFNQRQIRRRGGCPWTAANVASRWSELHRPKRNRTQKVVANTVLEPIVLRKSA